MLGRQGKTDVGLAGSGALPGKKRREPKSEVVARRLAKLGIQPAPAAEGVVALNPGFFALERIRAATVGGKKERAKRRGKAKSR